jgi:hypothetical protein
MKQVLTVERLQELFARNKGKPLTARQLYRSLKANREELFSFLRSHRDLFGAAIRRPVHGGSRSATVIFLRSNPPPGLRPPKPKTPIAVPKIDWPTTVASSLNEQR